MELTEHDLLRLKNREWRLNNLYWITNKQKKKIKFKMNPAQLLIHQSDEKLKASLKARQLGVSTYHIIEKIDKAFFGKNKTVVIIAHEQDAIKKLFRIAKYAYDKMNPLIRPAIGRGGGSQYEMYFPLLNSRIYCDLESRGDTISDLHISEYAFCDMNRIDATIDAVPVEFGNISIESTPKGLNHFHKDWNKEGWPYEKFFFPWFVNREYKLTSAPISDYSSDEIKLKDHAKSKYDIELTDEEIAFRRFKILQKGKSNFLQEFPEDEMSCFLMSGAPVMDKFLLQDMLNNLMAPLKIIKDLQIYKEFKSGNQYVIGADVAEGIGSDYSIASVFNRETLEQVACYGAHIKPFDFALMILSIASIYTDDKDCPVIAVERNNHGHAVIGKIEEMQYSKIYKAEDKRNGWLTSSVTRPVMIDTFIDGLENFNVTINDKQTIKECMTLIDNKGKIEAERGCHDDRVIASAIAVQVCLKRPIERNIRITGL